MRRRSNPWVTLAIWAVGASANAQDAPPQSAPDDVSAQQAAPTPSAQELYDLAFEALAQGARQDAAAILRVLVAQHAADRLAAQARELLAMMATGDVSGTAAGARLAAPATTSAARAELIAFQTVHGLAIGAELCLIVECDGARPWALMLMASTGSALAASTLLSRDGVTPGLARALTSGTEWGLWHGAMLMNATRALQDAYYEDEDIVIGTSLLLGQLGGLGTAGALYALSRPTAGQVSLASSGGIWTTATVGLTLAMINPPDIEVETVLWALVIASDVGLIGGGVLASQVPMSAGRALLIDAGGLLGGLTGAGTAALLSSEDPDPQVIAGIALVGMFAGLGLSYHITTDWDDGRARGDTPRLSLGLLPAQGGAIATAVLRN